MSVIRVNNITNRSGSAGPTIAGVGIVSSTSYMVVPTGRTGQRYADEGENIVRDGLVLYVDAKYSYPNSGVVGIATTVTGPETTTWYDLTGNGNDFEVKGGLRSGALTYDSSSNGGIFNTTNGQITNYLLCGPFDHPKDNITIELWIKVNASETGKGIFSYASSSNDNDNLIFNPSNIELYGPGSTVNIRTQINIADGIWRQVVRTRKLSGEENLYINGLVGYSTVRAIGSTFTSSGAIILAHEQDALAGGLDSSQALSGSFSIVRIYNKALSAAEVSQNFNANRSRFGI